MVNSFLNKFLSKRVCVDTHNHCSFKEPYSELQFLNKNEATGRNFTEEEIEETIARELNEELAISVQVGECLLSFEHSYSHKKLRFVVHICKWLGGAPKPIQSQQIRWVQPNELIDYPFPAANAKIISALNHYLQK